MDGGCSRPKYDPPKDACPDPWNPECYHIGGVEEEIVLADVIKLRILRWTDYPASSVRSKHHHLHPSKEEENEM